MRRGKYKPQQRTVWTPPVMARLEALFDEGLSRTRIAARLSSDTGRTFTRGHVAGKMWREGFGAPGDDVSVPSSTVALRRRDGRPKWAPADDARGAADQRGQQ